MPNKTRLIYRTDPLERNDVYNLRKFLKVYGIPRRKTKVKDKTKMEMIEALRANKNFMKDMTENKVRDKLRDEIPATHKLYFDGDLIEIPEKEFIEKKRKPRVRKPKEVQKNSKEELKEVISQEVVTQKTEKQIPIKKSMESNISKYYKIKKITGDGNCLFRCFAWLLQRKSEEDHKQIRENLVEWLKYPQHLEYPLGESESLRIKDGMYAKKDQGGKAQEIREWFAKMEKPGTYGDIAIIQAAANYYKVKIIVYNENSWGGTPFIIYYPWGRGTDNLGPDAQPVPLKPLEIWCLYYSNPGDAKAHFDVLVRLDDTEPPPEHVFDKAKVIRVTFEEKRSRRSKKTTTGTSDKS